MARMEYFSTFPTVEYDMGKDNKTRTVTNIMRRVGIRGDFLKLLPTYYKQVLTTDQRPEMAADHLYGEAAKLFCSKRNWEFKVLTSLGFDAPKQNDRSLL